MKEFNFFFFEIIQVQVILSKRNISIAEEIVKKKKSLLGFSKKVCIQNIKYYSIVLMKKIKLLTLINFHI